MRPGDPEGTLSLCVEPTVDVASLLGSERFVHLSATKGFALAAHSIGYSERTLRRRFSEHGACLSKAVEAFRKREIVLMLTSGASLTFVCGRLGFASASGFSRFVRRHFAMAPSALRRQILISNLLRKNWL